VISTLRKDERGFTLIELLVVMVILSVLAAVGLALFAGQRAKAQDAEAKTAATMVAQALEVYHLERDTYVGADRATLARYEPAIQNVRGLRIDGGASRYEISVDSAAAAGGGPFLIVNENGDSERSCTVPGQGGCPATGRW
jgi:prepilin-type N-terminal cleavage/methylation domain-containing protein